MGSVHPYETKAGKRLYRIIYRRPDHSQTSERGFQRKIDAERRLREVETAKDRGEYIDPASASATVSALGVAWLKQRERVLKPSSYEPLK